jgi:hypothetical protein
MFGIREPLIKLPEGYAPSGCASTPAVIPLASRDQSRCFNQPMHLESSCPSTIRGRTSLESHSCKAIKSNPFRMITFAKVTSAPSAFGRSLRRNSVRICTLGEYRLRGRTLSKPFRMIFLYKGKNNCPGITLLQKKVGGGGGGALSVPNDPGVGTRPLTPLLKEESR